MYLAVLPSDLNNIHSNISSEGFVKYTEEEKKKTILTVHINVTANNHTRFRWFLGSAPRSTSWASRLLGCSFPQARGHSITYTRMVEYCKAYPKGIRKRERSFARRLHSFSVSVQSFWKYYIAKVVQAKKPIYTVLRLTREHWRFVRYICLVEKYIENANKISNTMREAVMRNQELWYGGTVLIGNRRGRDRER